MKESLRKKKRIKVKMNTKAASGKGKGGETKRWRRRSRRRDDDDGDGCRVELEFGCGRGKEGRIMREERVVCVRCQVYGVKGRTINWVDSMGSMAVAPATTAAENSTYAVSIVQLHALQHNRKGTIQVKCRRRIAPQFRSCLAFLHSFCQPFSSLQRAVPVLYLHQSAAERPPKVPDPSGSCSQPYARHARAPRAGVGLF